MQRLMFSLLAMLVLSSSQKDNTLKGTWEYRGGKFNNKISPAPKGYSQQRKYTDKGFEAYLLEKGEKPVKYEAGNYSLKGDTCLEIQTYCLQSQEMVGVVVRYSYRVKDDTLFLNATLPNGARVEDYWKKIKP
ncbi:hypothetical protein [Mucilaginibacter sp.]|uniref:hypothetical protein n=1 Tax=Mucilaginibacter sp. TaxID=1882438 RepID=UPI0026161C1C|nr:hypothetical protein [Mucilaginibacter sp.]MDB4924927.1 hypothetical protein [Mucilaginibacter sp.]